MLVRIGLGGRVNALIRRLHRLATRDGRDLWTRDGRRIRVRRAP